VRQTQNIRLQQEAKLGQPIVYCLTADYHSN